MTDQSKNRKKLAAGFFIFLGLMWLCTIISKSIYVSRLPRVQTENPSKKFVEHKVEAEGMVSEGAEIAVTSLDGLRVENVFVRTGDRVEEGADLFRVDLEDLNELIKKKELDIKTMQYKISDLQANKKLQEQKKQIEEQRAKEDYDQTNSKTGTTLGRAESARDKADQTLKSHKDNPVSVTSNDDRNKAWDRYNEWVSKEKDLVDKISEIEIIITNMETPPDDTVSGGSISSGHQMTEDEKKELEAAKEQLKALREALSAHEQSRVSQPDFSEEDSAQQNYNNETKTLEDSAKSAGFSKDDAETDRAKALRDAQRSVDDTLFPESVDSTLSIYNLELEQYQDQMNKLKKIKKAEGFVKAESSGMITDIFVNAGSRIPDTAAVLMTDDQVPCQFKATIDKENKKYIKMGDTITLKLDSDKKGIEATVDYLSESKTAPGSYEIFCNLPDKTGTPGMSGTIEATVSGDTHNNVIPIAALGSEEMNTRFFINVVKEREGILGAELYAEKIYVNVLDKNDKFAALEDGSVDDETNIITSSSDVYKSGDVVRYDD